MCKYFSNSPLSDIINLKTSIKLMKNGETGNRSGMMPIYSTGNNRGFIGKIDVA